MEKRGIYRWTVILPMILFMYMLAYIDRTNISFAMGGIEKSFAVTSTISGFVSGIFFIGYTLLQVPGGHLASTVSARRNILVFGILTGIFASAQGFATSVTMFVIIRFFLGVVEGVMLPTTYVLIARWFAEEERGRATNTFMLFSTIGPLIMSPLCGYLLAYMHIGSFESWRTMLILEGIFPLIFSVVFYLVVRDHPSQTEKLGDTERQYLLDSMEKEALKPKIIQEKSYWKAIKNQNFILITFSWFLMVVGNYGTSMWLPDIVKSLVKVGDVGVGLISAIPWIITTFAMLAIGYINDKWGNKRMLLFMLEIIAGISMVISAIMGADNPVLAIIFLILTMMCANSASPTYLTTVPLFIAPAMLGGVMGIFSAVGNLGGFFGPLAVGKLITMSGGNKLAGLMFLGGVYILSGFIMLFVNLKAKDVN